jgi:hypothetical protein
MLLGVPITLGFSSPLLSATVVYCDSISAIYMSTNLVQHRRTKHIEIDIHFQREKVAPKCTFFMCHLPISLQMS